MGRKKRRWRRWRNRQEQKGLANPSLGRLVAYADPEPEPEPEPQKKARG